MNNSYYNVSHSRDYYKGKSVEFAGEWVPGVRYFNDEYLNSLVVYTEKDEAGHVIHSALLACKKTHISSKNSSVSDSTNNQPNLIVDDTLGVTGIGPNDYWIFISGSLAGTPGKFSEIVNTYLEALTLANENNIGKVVFVKEEKSIYNIVGAGELKKIVYTPEFVELLNSKVDKERGKGLSTNDYSNSEKTKLEGIEENAQRNIIEEVHLNGDKIEPIDKVVSFDAVKSIDGQTGDITLKGDSENTWDVNSHIVEGQIHSKVVTPKSIGSSTTPIYFNENGEVSTIDIDTEATENSDNLITSGAVYRNLNLKQDRLEAGENITIVNNVISSTNNVDLTDYAKTKDVDTKLATKQDTLTAGSNITIEDNIISFTGNIDLTDYAKTEDVNKKLDTKQDTLISGNGINIEDNVIGVTAITESETQPNTSIWINPSENTEIDTTYNRSQIDALINSKQDTISDLEDIRQGAELGNTALQEHQDISHLATKTDLTNSLVTKQDTIVDLADIRSGASKGATAVQLATLTEELNKKANKSHTHTTSDITDFPSIPNKTSELINDIGYITTVPDKYITDTELDAKGYLTKHQDISHLATTEEVENKLATKQDSLTDNDGGYGQRIYKLEKDGATKTYVNSAIASAIITALNTEI